MKTCFLHLGTCLTLVRNMRQTFISLQLWVSLAQCFQGQYQEEPEFTVDVDIIAAHDFVPENDVER